MVLKMMQDFDDYEKMLEFQDFEDDAGILMILKMMVGIDDFEGHAGL